MSGSSEARRSRRAAADRLLEALDEQSDGLDELAREMRLGRTARVRVREHVEDSAGHEADTLFGSWLDADDRVAARLERYVRLAQASIAAEALRPHLGTLDIVPMSNRGDVISEWRSRGGWVESDGQFPQDLDRALLAGEIDLVVHSY